MEAETPKLQGWAGSDAGVHASPQRVQAGNSCWAPGALAATTVAGNTVVGGEGRGAVSHPLMVESMTLPRPLQAVAEFLHTG